MMSSQPRGQVTLDLNARTLAGLTDVVGKFAPQATDAWRRFADHLLVCSLAAALMPHLMKDMIDQERPDRLTIEGHLRGIPLSGKANDAFRANAEAGLRRRCRALSVEQI